MMFKVVILTISDRGSKGDREDSSGPLIQEMVRDLPAEVIHYEIIPDEKEMIAMHGHVVKASHLPRKRQPREQNPAPVVDFKGQVILQFEILWRSILTN